MSLAFNRRKRFRFLPYPIFLFRFTGKNDELKSVSYVYSACRCCNMQCVMHDNNILLIWSQLTLSFIMLMWPPALAHQPKSEYGASIWMPVLDILVSYLTTMLINGPKYLMFTRWRAEEAISY